MFAQAYAAGRWAASPVRVVALYLNSLPDDVPVVTQQFGSSRHLRPFLDRADRFQVAGGRPGRLDPLPGLLAAGPFRYVEAPGDGDEILALLDQSGRCPTRLPLDQWRIWLCNGAELRRLPASARDCAWRPLRSPIVCRPMDTCP